MIFEVSSNSKSSVILYPTGTSLVLIRAACLIFPPCTAVPPAIRCDFVFLQVKIQGAMILPFICLLSVSGSLLSELCTTLRIILGKMVCRERDYCFVH